MVHQSLPESHRCVVRCFDKAVDPPVLVCSFRKHPGTDAACVNSVTWVLEQWRVGLIIGVLPVLMSAITSCVPCGIGSFYHPLRVSTAGVVGAITFISFSAYIVTNFLPILYPSCPYKTPPVTIHVPSIRLYTAANSWIFHFSHAKGG